MKRFVSVALTVLAAFASGFSSSAANEIGYAETFALAEDRAKALEQLIPGTEDYYFYHALHFQNTGQAKELADIMAKWRNRIRSSGLRSLIERRERIKAYDTDPKATLEWLRRELSLNFSHQRDREPGQKPNLPTSLDPKLVDREAYIKRATYSQDNLNGFQDSALDWILREGGVELTSNRRRALLSRLDRPDYDNLVELVAADLKTKESRGFGEFKIHRQMLKIQLDALLKAKPDLRTNTNFINTYLTKLAPGADADVNDPEVRQAHLERMWGFVKDLAPAHNSLKANVLYALLDHQRKAGKYDRELFTTYVKLPRSMGYMEPEYLRRDGVRNYVANLGQDYAQFTRCSQVGNDTDLVRDYLLQLLVEQDDMKPWTEWIRDTFVKPLMAEAKILAGVGDAERWASMLTPSAYQALKDRVDIQLALINPQQFAIDEEVTLVADIKNVDKLLVKVYEVNALNVYLATQREINTGLALDGLVAGSEKEYSYKESPFRRVRREFNFPELKGEQGVWMIELIGSGRSSRALVRKGGLHYLSRQSVAGTMLRILDQDDKPVAGASAWMAGREYTPDKQGAITIPYSNQPGSRPMILRTKDGFASLVQFQHDAEKYTLSAGFFVDREALRVGGEAKLLVRPDFRVNGVAAPLELLENVKLTIVSTNLDGVNTTAEIPDFELFADKDSEYEFAVPPRLLNVSFRLDAQVEQISTGKKTSLAAIAQRTVNTIDSEQPTFDLHLSRMDGHAVIEVLGKNGERLADRAVRFTIQHRDFKSGYSVSLKSDKSGRIDLGLLPDIANINASSDGTRNTSWNFATGQDAHSRPAVLHCLEGDPVLVPHLAGKKLSRGDYSLLSHNGTFLEDHFDKLSLSTGFLVVKGLPAGDYSLKIKSENRVIPIKVTKGQNIGRFAAGKRRILEVAPQLPLHIIAVAEDDKELVVKLANAGERTRVHVLASRFEPVFPLKNALGGAYHPPVVAITRPSFRNLYLSGRDIGDEYRYILDRREQTIYPGNMLERPGLLLNPWELRDTDTGKQQAGAGGEYAERAGATRGGRGSASQQGGGGNRQLSDFSNLDFLYKSGVLMANLTPDKNGTIRIAKDQLANRQDIHVVAIGATDTVYRRVSMSDSKAKFRDLRLAETLDLEKHFTEQKEVALLATSDKLNIPDVRAAELQEYDTLESIYSLYMTRSSNSTLGTFAFVLEWDDLKPEEQREKYSKYASHELSFFLSRKDPTFFDDVVTPYLKNKKDKTFLDHYLLEDDLDSYLDPWRYSRLNIAERVLLAARLGKDERKAALRHLTDLYAGREPDPATRDMWFATALRGRSLNRPTGLAGDSLRSLSRFDAPAEMPMEEAEVMDEAFSGKAYQRVAGQPMAPAARPPVVTATKPMAKRELERMEKLSEVAKVMKEGDKGARYLSEFRNGNDADGAVFGIDAIITNGVADVAKRKSQRGYYRKMSAVKEWAENNYYHRPIDQQLSGLVPVNAFWRDYAEFLSEGGEGPFLSEHVAEPTSNFTEMMLALAVLDMPREAKEHKIETDTAALTFEAASPTIIFHKQIQEAPVSDDKTPVLVGQNFFRHGDRYQQVDGQQRDKYVTEEFLPGVVYGCQVVVTNPTSATQKLDVLVQIPERSLPVLGSKRTRSMPVQLGPYATQKLEYYFYFPKTGDFAHYPVQVARDESLAAWADPFTFHVVEQLSKIDKASWDYVSQWGSSEEVISYLEQNNVQQLNLDRIAWRMRDIDFFSKTLELLAGRHAYSNVLWSYSIYHNKLARIQEYLRTQENFLRRLGDHVDCTLASVDPVERHWLQHLEYSPLVNARAHRLGTDRKIVNSAFHQQYHRLLNVLRYKEEVTEEDKLDVVYYMFLQDRVGEALAWFNKIETKELATQLQLDYLRCYVAFYLEEPGDASKIAKRYADYPVDKWQKRFATVLSQADEIGGGQVADSGSDESEREGMQDQLASTEPALEMKVESGQVKLTYQNLDTVTVNYYEMDLEFLFSSNPFVESEGQRFGVIKPNRSDTVKLAKKGDTQSIAIPKDFAGKNVLVEVICSGRRVSQAYYANNLKLQLVEQYGRLQVRHAETNKPLSKVYVKVYARTPQGSKFFKDGYTDLRGKFDYTSLNTDDIGSVAELAILVMSDEHGAVVKTAKPPQQ